jgi:hypothetical protein
MVGGGDGGCQPFLSSIPIEVLLGNRVVVLLYTLVSSLQSFVREFSLVLERGRSSLLTTPFQGIYVYGNSSFEKKIKIHTPQRRKQDMEGTTTTP